MRNEFLEKLAHLQDHIQQIYDHYEVLYPNNNKSHKIIDLNNGYVLRVRESAVFNHKTLVTSLDKKDTNNENTMKYYSVIVFEQDNQNKNIGQVKFGKTEDFRFINEKEFEKIFNETDVEKGILLESEKLQRKLQYNFSKELPQRMIFSLPDDGSSLYLARTGDSVELKINFPKSHKNGENNFNANYDYRKLKEIFNVFDRLEFSCAFKAITKEDKINDVFLNFYENVKKIDSELFTEEIKKALIGFNDELEIIKNFIEKLSFNNSNKKLKI